jgi:hypothetical protein
LFVSLAAPHKHLEAITSTHAKQGAVQKALRSIAQFLSSLKTTAEQLTDKGRIRLILQRAFAK